MNDQCVGNNAVELKTKTMNFSKGLWNKQNAVTSSVRTRDKPR